MRYISDPFFYVKTHIEQLSNLAHQYIREFIFVVSDFNNIRYDFPDEIQGRPVKVIYRPNQGLSYGALDEGMHYVDINSHFIFFIEDDYMPMIHNFDEVFLNKMNSNTSNGYVCSLFKDDHAAISNGLLRFSHLKTVLDMGDGHLSFHPSSDYGQNESQGQVALSQTLKTYNSYTVDVADEYLVPFRTVNGAIIEYGKVGAETIIAPI